MSVDFFGTKTGFVETGLLESWLLIGRIISRAFWDPSELTEFVGVVSSSVSLIWGISGIKQDQFQFWALVQIYRSKLINKASLLCSNNNSQTLKYIGIIKIWIILYVSTPRNKCVVGGSILFTPSRCKFLHLEWMKMNEMKREWNKFPVLWSIKNVMSQIIGVHNFTHQVNFEKKVKNNKSVRSKFLLLTVFIPPLNIGPRAWIAFILLIHNDTDIFDDVCVWEVGRIIRPFVVGTNNKFPPTNGLGFVVVYWPSEPIRWTTIPLISFLCSWLIYSTHKA